MRSGQARPDLIILDCSWRKDGFEFLREVRPHCEWSKIPVVVVSSLDLNNEAQQVLKDRWSTSFKKGALPEKTCCGSPRNHQSAHC